MLLLNSRALAVSIDAYISTGRLCISGLILTEMMIHSLVLLCTDCLAWVFLQLEAFQSGQKTHRKLPGAGSLSFLAEPWPKSLFSVSWCTRSSIMSHTDKLKHVGRHG